MTTITTRCMVRPDRLDGVKRIRTLSVRSDVCLAVCCNITGAKHCTNNVRSNGVYLVYCLFCKQFILPHSNTTTRAITASIPSRTHTTTRQVTHPLLWDVGSKNNTPASAERIPPTAAPPLFQRDAGGSFSPLDGGIGEGEPQGGIHDVRGPPGASRTETTTFVVVSFLPFLLR